MIDGYRVISGRNVSGLYRTVPVAKRAAMAAGLGFPAVVVRDYGFGTLCDLHVCHDDFSVWQSLRKGLKRGAVVVSDVEHVEVSERVFVSRPYLVNVCLWGEDFKTWYASRPSSRQVRAGVKDIKRFYFAFHGEPIAEGE